MAYDYKIGSTLVGLTDLVSGVGIAADPKSSYRPYSQYVKLGNGIRKGLGYPVAVWHWDFMSLADRNLLKAYVTNGSVSLFIRTRKDDDSYANFECVAEWPEEEQKDAGRRLDFDLIFTHMVQQ